MLLPRRGRNVIKSDSYRRKLDRVVSRRRALLSASAERVF